MKSSRRYLGLLGLAISLTALGAGCDNGSSPVAPAGTVLRVTANPKTISIDGASTIEISALKDGFPVPSGTEIRLTASQGSIEDLVFTDGDGFATATFRPDGRPGTATIQATSGLATGSSGTATVTIENRAIVAAFSVVKDGLTAIFTDDSSGDPTQWQWDFGDGSTSTEQDPVHAYAETGAYLVTLTVSNPNGSDSVTETLEVGDFPDAAFSFVVEGLTVLFNDESTGQPTKWEWSFGDGQSSSLQNPIHVYGAAGTFAVVLTVTVEVAGGADLSDSVTQFVTVEGAPAADFSFLADGLRVRFTDLSSGDPTSWLWEFGDGTISGAQHPVHDYPSSGSYLVRLTVSGPSGESTKTDTVVVVGRPTADFTFVVNGLNVDFVDQSTNSPAQWSWDFGDAATSTTQNPTHTYAAAGTYDATLVVTNSAGESTLTRSVTVP